MVNSAFPILAILALSRAVGAVPTAAASTFSFQAWVEDLIANPAGALTAEEAVAAYRASQNNTEGVAAHESRGLLQARLARCYEVPNTEAYIPDAVACIQRLANSGSQACVNQYTLCQIGQAVITADGKQTSTCNDCARGAGYIMDQCTRGGVDWVEGSEYAYGNGNELIRIRKP